MRTLLFFKDNVDAAQFQSDTCKDFHMLLMYAKIAYMKLMYAQVNVDQSG